MYILINTDWETVYMEKTAKNKTKKIIGIILFVLLNVVIIGYTAYSEYAKNGNNVQNLFKLEVKWIYLLPAVLCLVIAVLSEAFKYILMMRKTGVRVDAKTALEVTVLGKYYDNITPSAIGGQPFQIYYLSKRGYTSGTSAAMPVASFLSMQFAFSVMALAVFIFNGKAAGSIAIKIAAYIGLFFYLFLPVAILLFNVIPGTFHKIIAFFINLLHKIKLIKDPDKTINVTVSKLDEYRGCISLISKEKGLITLLMLLSFLYQAALCSIPYFVLLMFGGNIGWLESVSSVLFIYSAITIIPTPGNSGAAEGSFYALFTKLSTGHIFWAMLVWRIIVYYLYLISGVAVYLINALVGQKKNETDKITEKPEVEDKEE